MPPRHSSPTRRPPRLAARLGRLALLLTPSALLAPLVAGGVVPGVGLLVDVDETYFHCGKALMRAKLWDPSRQVDRASFPSLGRIIAEQTAAIAVAEAEAIMEEGYRTRLY